MKGDFVGTILKDVALKILRRNSKWQESQIVHAVLGMCEVLKGRPSKNVLWQ